MRQAVGESLDWSAPDLLKALGLPMEDLVRTKMATWKRHVTLKSRDGCSEHYVPTPWLGGAPFHIELRTLHVDRVRLDQKLLQPTIDFRRQPGSRQGGPGGKKWKKNFGRPNCGRRAVFLVMVYRCVRFCHMPAGAGIQSPRHSLRAERR